MAKQTEAMKLITVPMNGVIRELGGISGPIINPTLQPVSVIIRMLNTRKKVYEVNPNNYNEKILLNLRNVQTENFPPKTNVTANVAPKAVETVKKTIEEKKTEEPTKVETETEKKNQKSDFTKK